MGKQDYLTHFDARDAGDIVGFFRDLGLPLPLKGEFRRATNGGRCMVFLNDFGLVVQVAKKTKTLDFEHPRFLKPLYKRETNSLRLWIDPGIDCPVSKEEVSKFYQELALEHKVVVNDATDMNFGGIPGSEERYLVVLDLDRSNISMTPMFQKYLGRLGFNARDVFKAGNEYFSRSAEVLKTPQDTVYGGLRKLANKAFSGSGNVQDRQRFYVACLDMKRQGKLLSRWVANDYHGTSAAAGAYASRSRLRDLVV